MTPRARSSGRNSRRTRRFAAVSGANFLGARLFGRCGGCCNRRPQGPEAEHWWGFDLLSGLDDARIGCWCHEVVQCERFGDSAYSGIQMPTIKAQTCQPAWTLPWLVYQDSSSSSPRLLVAPPRCGSGLAGPWPLLRETLVRPPCAPTAIDSVHDPAIAPAPVCLSSRAAMTFQTAQCDCAVHPVHRHLSVQCTRPIS